MKAFLVLASCVALSGCGTLSGVTPEQITSMVNAAAAAGCKGTMTNTIGGATGQLGGGFHAEHTFTGTCDPSSVAPKPPTAPVPNP